MTNTEELRLKIFDYLRLHSVDLMGDTYTEELAEHLKAPFGSKNEQVEFDNLFDEVFSVFAIKVENLKLEE